MTKRQSLEWSPIVLNWEEVSTAETPSVKDCADSSDFPQEPM